VIYPPPGKRLGTNHTADWVGPRVSVNRFERSHTHHDDKLLMPKLNMATNPAVLGDKKSILSDNKGDKDKGPCSPHSTEAPCRAGKPQNMQITKVCYGFFWTA
jgi:hypothetical protein